jgi:hypothetical protein
MAGYVALVGKIKKSMEATVFWDIMLCSLIKVYQGFSGKYCLHLQV